MFAWNMDMTQIRTFKSRLHNRSLIAYSETKLSPGLFLNEPSAVAKTIYASELGGSREPVLPAPLSLSAHP